MALSHPDRRPLGPWTALVAAGALLFLQPACPASSTLEPIQINGFRPDFNSNAGTLSIETLELTQGRTLLKASKAEATGLVDGKYENSTWTLTDAVHMEFDGATLDAQSATVVFADGQVKSVRVQPGITQPQQAKHPVHLEFNNAVLDARNALVTFVENRVDTVRAEGTPAQFSHQLKNSARRANGHAARIDYDAGKSLIHVSGDAWLTTGNIEFQLEDITQLEAITYNLSDGSASSNSKFSGTFRPKDKPGADEKVPAPRTPDRGTAR
jgi:lipopolysaccharide transport protein LptA